MVESGTTTKQDTGCTTCDLGALDDLHCRAEALEKQSSLATEYQAKLEERRPKLADAREAYTTARKAAEAAVVVIDTQLDHIREQLDCLLKDIDLDCLLDSWTEVQEILESCPGPPSGCCADPDCHFDDRLEGSDEKDLTARIAEIEKKVAASEACFDSLILEPTDIPTRVSTLGADVTQLGTDVCDATKDTGRERLYIRMLVLQGRRDNLWKGFDDANDFYECLCQALTCAVEGRQVLITLYGALVTMTCQETKETERCASLRDDLVDETWALYVRRCKGQPCPDGQAGQTVEEEEGSSDTEHDTGDRRCTG
jgi:hypothetical protein